MKKINLNESDLKRIVLEAIKQITDGSEKAVEPEIDVPAYYVNREIKKLVDALDKIGYEYLDRNDSDPSELYDAFGSKILAMSEDLGHFMESHGYDKSLRKNYGQMMEGIARELKESGEPMVTDGGAWEVLNACISAIIDTEKRGRRFPVKYSWREATPEQTKHESVLNTDEEYQQLREELIGNMEAYFNSAKKMLWYLSNSGYLNEYDLEQAKRYLGKEFTPNW